jgi:hypothetical protein
LETAQKQKKSAGAVHNTPPRDAVHGSGINPQNVPRPVIPPAPAAPQAIERMDALLFEHQDVQGDDEEEEESTEAPSGGSAAPAINSLLSRFASPLGESAHTAIPVDAVAMRITPIAQLRQSQPVAYKAGTVCLSTALAHIW